METYVRCAKSLQKKTFNTGGHTVSKTFDALIKAEAESKAQKRQKRRGVNFSALSVFKDKGRPIKIDFDLDPFVEEQYHRLRRHLLPNSKHGATKVVMVAATDHGEGGTTTAAILASTLARSGTSKILLVDANLRTPALDEVFEPGQGSKLWDCRIRSYPRPRWIRPFTRRIYRICLLCLAVRRSRLPPICLTVNRSLPCCLRSAKNSTSSSLMARR